MYTYRPVWLWFHVYLPASMALVPCTPTGQYGSGSMYTYRPVWLWFPRFFWFISVWRLLFRYLCLAAGARSWSLLLFLISGYLLTRLDVTEIHINSLLTRLDVTEIHINSLLTRLDAEILVTDLNVTEIHINSTHFKLDTTTSYAWK